MATLVTTLPSVMWSGDIPDLNFTATDHINLAVEVDGTVIFATTIYTHNSYGSLVELSELVEQHMEAEGDFMSEVTVYEVDDEDPTDQTQMCQFQVIYCSINVSNSCEDFCRKHFLTTAHSKRLERGVVECLYFYDPDNAGDDLRLQVGYLDGNTMRIAMIGNASTLIDANCVKFDIDEVAELADVDNVALVVFALGARQMLYYTNNIPSDAVFSFVNCFNCPEILTLNCVTVNKQTGNRTVAQVRRRSVLASLDHDVEFEVATAPLTSDEASLVEQLCESHNIALLPQGEDMIISSRTCEFSDERGEMPSAKFTWKHLDNRRHATIAHTDGDGIFSDEFDNIYD